MIFRYAFLKQYPVVFRSCTGLTPTEFELYVDPLIIQLAETENKRLESRENRQRAVGGGRKAELSLTNQLLLTLVWLRLYPTYEVLGYFFKISDSSAYRVVKSCLPILEASGYQQMERSKAHASRKRGYKLDQIFDQIPGLVVIVDAFEQQIERPTNQDEADRYYSRKRKDYRLKSQITVDAYTAEILDVAPSLNGRRQDKGYFNESGVTARLPDDTSYMADLGYPGLDKELERGRIPRKKPRDKPRPEADKEYNKIFSRARVPVEHSIGRLRSYKSLNDRDRHHRQMHHERVVAVAGIVDFTKRQRYVY